MDAQQQRDSLSQAFLRVADTMRTLTAEDGCAWHNVQDHQSLVRYLIEECYEVVQSIETGAEPRELRDELGDLLYQVLFHAAIAERNHEGFSLTDVCEGLADKLVARHPHVFGTRGYMSVDELNEQWEQLKADAAGASRGVLDGIAEELPSLARAEKMVDRVERAGLAPDIFTADEATAGSYGERVLALLREAHAEGVNVDASLRAAMRDLEQKIAKI